MKKYPEYAFVYRHGDVNPGCFVYYKGTSYIHPKIVRLFDDGLLLKILTFDNKRPIWTILDGAAAIPTGTSVARMVVLASPGKMAERYYSNSLRPTNNSLETLVEIRYYYCPSTLAAIRY
jgi:hypothetical protein